MFDYSNPEAALEQMNQAETERRDKLKKASEIPNGTELDSRVKDVTRGVVQSGTNKGAPKWVFEVSLLDPGKPWNKWKRNLHYSDASPYSMQKFWDILKAWGIHPAVLKGEADPIGRLNEIIEQAIEDGARIPLRVEHAPDRRDPTKNSINYREIFEKIEPVYEDTVEDVTDPEDESQEPAEELGEVEPELPPEEEAPKPAAKKKPRKASPFTKRAGV